MKQRERESRNLDALETANKIFEIGLLASQSTNLQKVLKAIAERIRSETDACYVSISLVDPKRQEVVHGEYSIRRGTQRPQLSSQPVGSGVIGQVVTTGRPFSLPNVEIFSDYVTLVPGMRSELAVPLKIGGEVIGVLNLESQELGKFDAMVQAMVQAFATPMAQAVQNARLFHRERLRRQQLSLLNRVGRIVATESSLDDMMGHICRSIREQLGYGLVGMALVDEDGKRVVLRAVSTQERLNMELGYSQALGEGVVGEVTVTGVSMLVPDVRKRANYVSAGETLLTEICCPLKSGDEVFGVLDAENAEPGSFDESDLLMLETVAEHVSQAILNRRNVERVTRLREDLSSMIVHDLRSPVTVIQSTLQLLVAQSTAREDAAPSGTIHRRDPRAYIQHAQRSCDEMLALIDSLLELQKLESGELRVSPHLCAPADIPRSVVTRLQVVAESLEIALVSDSHDEVPAAQLDLDLVSRVLQNLVSNALKFTPRNGRVVVGAAPAPQATLDERLPGLDRGLLFTVRDTGPGIPDDERERIFEKFGVVESRKAGIKLSTGLGLAFCKQAVRAHRGAIWVENAPEGGSIFGVLLPLGLDE